jgi:predicted ATPase
MMGHRLMGSSVNIAEARAHYDQALLLYDPAEHRPLAARFGQDVRVAILSNRSLPLWLLGHSEAALADAEQALKYARETSQAATLVFALFYTSLTCLLSADYRIAKAVIDELVALADEKGVTFWKAGGVAFQGSLLALTGQAAGAVHPITSGITAWRSTGATVFVPWLLSCLARAYAELGRYDDAWRCIGEAINAIETTKESRWEAEVNRVAGEISLMSPEPDAVKAEAYFERALAVARQQQAKSWELRAAMSLARLWRNQGNVREARELLALVYGWFTEGFETRDLKEAKELLDELAA